jgi:hypothetical protein
MGRKRSKGVHEEWKGNTGTGMNPESVCQGNWLGTSLCARGHVVIILQIPFLKQLSRCKLFKENPWNRTLACRVDCALKQ